MTIASTEHDLSFLRHEFLRDAKVIDLERGYISASAFNLRMKPAILATAASRLLIIDDVCATGETGVGIVEGLLTRGVRVAAVAQTGVKVFSCIRVTEIGKHDHIQIAP